MTEEEHAYLILFVAAAQFRTRSSRDHHAGQWQNALEIMDDIAESMKKATPDQRRRASGISGSSSLEDKSLSHEQVKKLAKTPLQMMIPGILGAVTPVLSKMNMLILTTEDSIGFITSDPRVTWYDPEAYKLPPLYRSPALGSPTIEVTMPLSPRQCLIIAWQCPTGYAHAPEVALNELNRRHRVHCGEHYIVQSNVTNEYWFEEFEPPEDAWENLHPKDDNDDETAQHVSTPLKTG